MAMTINTNVVSINAQRNLSLSSNSLSTSMQRLSSGLRVNSAKDDAAGLAIAERMTSQINGLTVASRNANDGISLAQTAEGALGKIGDMLQTMRELAVLSGNATNSASDRKALQAQLVQLREEVDRVAKTSSFNGTKLLDGSFTGAVFQVGANSGDNITVGALANAKVDQLSNAKYATAQVSGIDAAAKADAATAMTEAVTITIAGANGVSVSVTLAGQENLTGDEALGRVIQAINTKTADTGVVAFLNAKGDAIDFRALQGAEDDSDVVDTDFAIEVSSSEVEALVGVAASGFAAAGSNGIDQIDISTQAGAWEALQRLDSAIDKVSSSRAEMGAFQIRFEKTIENTDIMNENISTARGRITEADFAKETANLSRAQILQQAGTAMVSQANQLPQQVLSLLQ